ncbi:BRO-N domain-containing protein [Acinetobacter pollinis]|uniref:BRO-N domain-containing protein n=1 Tax=Acinetobacter pollinis TaxID=2605270 RepID=UPI0018C2E22D|nr:BRO family protein [Acinetobacter pollinis]MBF7694151.1 alpha/beta hydrolase [Acinetobacter pollinis]MBF7701737.1 alpha/beta hydrolase [Acinetobacter pollinis]
MNSLALSFNDVNFSPVEKDGQIWLTASELAKGLNYSDTRSVTKIFNRNADEFTENMTQIIEIPEVVNLGTSNLIRKVRIFNSRGCHLIAMFARTDVAKAFRKWVLDVLDKVSGQPVVVAKTHKEERAPLTSAVNLLVAKSKHLNYSDAYKLVHQRFNVEHIDEIPYDAISVAVEYVHQLIALYSSSKRQGTLFEQNNENYELIRRFTESVIVGNDGILPILMAVRLIDENKFFYYSNMVIRANEYAREVSRALDFRNKLNEPLLDEGCRIVSLSVGTRFKVKPNWFNCPA